MATLGPPEDSYICENNQLRLQCSFSTNPYQSPLIDWTRGSTPLANGVNGYSIVEVVDIETTFETMVTSTLTLSRITRNEAGLYRCTANNAIGSSSVTSNVTVCRKFEISYG